MSEILCHCGQPLHYSNPHVKRTVDDIVNRLGRFITVKVLNRKWKVCRHYIALHGIAADNIQNLGFEEIQ